MPVGLPGHDASHAVLGSLQQPEVQVHGRRRQQSSKSGNIGTGAGCFETQSRLALGESSSFVAPRELLVNQRVEPLNGNWTSPLPPMRHNGYCIQTTAGNNSFAAFAAW